jgi:leader peptidase (prepilin peptidase)/N-methyltransferase
VTSGASRRSPRGVYLAPVIVALIVVASLTLQLNHFLVAAFVATCLVVLAAIDLERGVIPNRIVLPATGIVLVAQIALFPARTGEWLLAPLLAAALLAVPHLLQRAWMGMGDVKLALLLGATLGWGVFGAIVLSFICVLPVALLLLLRGGLAARKTMIPFGPFMAVGALIVLLAPHISGIAGS